VGRDYIADRRGWVYTIVSSHLTMKGLVVCLFIFICGLGKAQYIKTASKLDEWQLELKDKEEKSIMDYYLLLPNAVFDCELDRSFDKNQRLVLITVQDIKNGFIEFEGDQKFSLALFKDRVNEIDYIAISNNHSGRGSTCGGLNTILQFASSKGWKYRTDVLPPKEQISYLVKEFYKNTDEISYYYKLPQFGLVVTLNDGSTDKVICKMKWKADKFELIE
jgi:hypothetical protein